MRRLLVRILAFAVVATAGAVAATVAPPSPPVLPDPVLTPGAAFQVDTASVCQPGYAKRVRNVGRRTKLRVYAEYDIAPNGQAFEVDHLIPLELGGSNGIKNLWPEARFTQPWNTLVKDKLERRLHHLVCSGRLQLQMAQQAIASNWIAAYRQFMPRGQIPAAPPM